MKKPRIIMRCPDHHTCEVEIKEEDGLRYYICPACNLVVGLPAIDKIRHFTGYNTNELIKLFEKKGRII